MPDNNSREVKTEKSATVDYFVVEGMMERMDIAMERLQESTADSMAKLQESTADSMAKMDKSNKHMHDSLRNVCITLIIIAVLFVVGYTINNMNWLHYVETLKNSMTEGSNALETPEVQQFGETGSD